MEFKIVSYSETDTIQLAQNIESEKELSEGFISIIKRKRKLLFQLEFCFGPRKISYPYTNIRIHSSIGNIFSAIYHVIFFPLFLLFFTSVTLLFLQYGIYIFFPCGLRDEAAAG